MMAWIPEKWWTMESSQWQIRSDWWFRTPRALVNWISPFHFGASLIPSHVRAAVLARIRNQCCRIFHRSLKLHLEDHFRDVDHWTKWMVLHTPWINSRGLVLTQTVLQLYPILEMSPTGPWKTSGSGYLGLLFYGLCPETTSWAFCVRIKQNIWLWLKNTVP